MIPLIDLISIIAVSSLITYLFLSWWIKTTPRIGLVGKDLNKNEDRRVPEAGGLSVIMGASFGIMLSIAYNVYLSNSFSDITLLAIVSLLLLSGFLGFIDDVTGWKKGLSPIKRILFTMPIALPLVIIKSGYSVIDLPLVGPVDLGVLYPLVVVPIGVMGASNAFNMIAGYNGLEAGQALVISLFTLAFCYIKGLFFLTPLLLSMISATLILLLYNKYPAKVFPGNTFTYSFGAFYAAIVITGNFEKFGITMFSLYFLELALFLRGLLNGVYKENFGIPQPDGSLSPPYEKAYSVTHLAIITLRRLFGKAYEKQVTLLVITWQAVIGAICLLLYT
jgi:UDP-N-acetylglucosamine--dolichyl-phosphate N-acetylglucosaminephosphotransferase